MRALALAVALLLVGCTASIPGRQPQPSPRPSSLQAFIPVAEKFVEAHRGLRFKAPVKVTFLPDAAFVSELEKANPVDAAGYATEAKVLHALALLDGLPDLAKAEQELQGGSVVGFYDPASRQLFVRGTDARASVRQVLVHELTHALQDQWFKIGRNTPSTDESDIAFRTLVEGDAVRIQQQYVASLSLAEQRQVNADSAAAPAPPADVPVVLEELDSFPYIAGPQFTRQLLAAGQDRLDAAFKKPPTTTAQVIHPQLFLNLRGPAPVDEPAADGTVIDRGVIGELGLDLILERLLRGGEVSQAQATAITSGWRGDRYIAWDLGSRTCVRARFEMASTASSGALLEALGRFAGDHPGTTVEGAGPVLFTACA